MGRTLQNTMINLGILGVCDEAMYQVSTIIFILQIGKKKKTKELTVVRVTIPC
jgi:hypothetical protein